MKYYEATGKTRERLIEIMAEREAGLDKFHKLAKRLKASYAVTQSGVGRTLMIGVKYGNRRKYRPPADSRLLKPYYHRGERRHDPDIYVPNQRYKEGKALAKEMDDLAAPGEGDICDIIKVPFLSASRAGFYAVHPYVGIFKAKRGKRVIVGLLDQIPETPKAPGLKRLSDVAAERLREQAPK